MYLRQWCWSRRGESSSMDEFHDNESRRSSSGVPGIQNVAFPWWSPLQLQIPLQRRPIEVQGTKKRKGSRASLYNPSLNMFPYCQLKFKERRGVRGREFAFSTPY
ncbi:hypothetical protein Ancab_030787 [Ancistrocladus abbreviatus]